MNLNKLNEAKASRFKKISFCFLNLLLHFLLFLFIQGIFVESLFLNYSSLGINLKNDIKLNQDNIINLSLKSHLLNKDQDDTLLSLEDTINNERNKLVKSSLLINDISLRGDKFLKEESFNDIKDHNIYYYLFIYQDFDSLNQNLKDLYNEFNLKYLDLNNHYLNKDISLILGKYIFEEEYIYLNEYDEFNKDYIALYESLIDDFENKTEYKILLNKLDLCIKDYNLVLSISLLISYSLSFIFIYLLPTLIKKNLISELIFKYKNININNYYLSKLDLIFRLIFDYLSNFVLLFFIILNLYPSSLLFNVNLLGSLLSILIIFSLIILLIRLIFLINKNKLSINEFIFKDLLIKNEFSEKDYLND